MGKKKEETKTETKEKKAVEEKSFNAPKGLGYVFSLAKGIKLHLHRIHIRYEDDYFNHHRPFSMGILIESIDLDS